MSEIWKDIVGYEDFYQISNKGRVKSKARDIYNKKGKFQRFKKENIKANKTSSDGYYKTTLSVNGKNKNISIHRLVGLHFIDNPHDYPEINHIDGNRKNNDVSNLEWCDRSYNIKHIYTLGNRSMKGSNNPNYGGTKLKQYYKNNPEKKVLLRRPGSQNGRSTPVVISKENEEIEFNYIGECAQWFKDSFEVEVKTSTIHQHLIKCSSSGKEYFGYKIKIIK